MIEYEIGVHLQPECVSRLDQVEQFCFGTEPRRHAAFLIELAQVIVSRRDRSPSISIQRPCSRAEATTQ